MPRAFSPPPRVSDPDMHHNTCVTHVPWCMPGSLTSGFLWSWWRGKYSRHSRRMHNPQFYVSGKRPMPSCVMMSSWKYWAVWEGEPTNTNETNGLLMGYHWNIVCSVDIAWCNQNDIRVERDGVCWWSDTYLGLKHRSNEKGIGNSSHTSQSTLPSQPLQHNISPVCLWWH